MEKVGLKGRHVKIPDEWEKVTEGVCRDGDKFAHTESGRFYLVDQDDIGLPFDSFDLLIRKAKKG